MEGISVRDSLTHISFVKCQVRFVNEVLELLPLWQEEAETDGLTLLLTSLGLTETDAGLCPSFDLDALRLRNQMKIKERLRCS